MNRPDEKKTPPGRISLFGGSAVSRLQTDRLYLSDKALGVVPQEHGINIEHGVTKAADVQDVARSAVIFQLLQRRFGVLKNVAVQRAVLFAQDRIGRLVVPEVAVEERDRVAHDQFG